MESFSDDTAIPIREKEVELISFVMGFHGYKNIWTPAENETLKTRMEPENKIDKFAVAVVGGRGEVVGHWTKGKTGRFAKTVFYFLRASQYNECNVRVIGKAVNEGDDGQGMKIPCILKLKGHVEFVDIPSKELTKQHLSHY